MQTVVIEFQTRREMEEAVHHLWDKLGVTGELLTQRVQDAGWRLEFIAEQPVRSTSLEKIGGRIVKS